MSEEREEEKESVEVEIRVALWADIKVDPSKGDDLKELALAKLEAFRKSVLPSSEYGIYLFLAENNRYRLKIGRQGSEVYSDSGPYDNIEAANWVARDILDKMVDADRIHILEASAAFNMVTRSDL